MLNRQSPTSLLEFEKVGRVFRTDAGPVHALKGISLTINVGEFVCIAGPSGAGKSTLLNIMGCLDRPSEGSFRLAGRDVGGLTERELATLRSLAVGFVFQDYGLLDSMTTLRNIELPAEYAGVPVKECARQAERLLRFFDLESRKVHFPAELSGGEQQRVAIARALMNGRRIILADEPTGALDSQASEQVLSLFQELASQGNTVVMVSHDSSVANAAARRIELLDGTVVSDSGAHREAAVPARSSLTMLQRTQTAWSAVAQAMRLGIESLRAARLRTALQVGGPVLGVASAIALLGLADGTYQASLKVVGSMGVDRVGIGQLPQPGLATLDTDDVRSIEGLDNVREVTSEQIGMMLVQRGGKDAVEAQVSGTQQKPDFMRTLWPLAAGRYVNRQDGEGMSQVAVIDHTLRDRFFAPGEGPLGEWINVEGVPFEIIGVLAPHPIMQEEPYRSRPSFPPFIFVPFATGKEMLFRDGESMGIGAYVEDIDRLEETASDIRDLLIRRLGHENFVVSTDRLLFGTFRDSIRSRITFLVAIAVPALLAGAAVTMALMLGAIRQRAQEIAIRKAIGARRGDIMRQFIAETCLITLAGISLGVPLGFFAGYVVELVLDAPSAYEPWYIWVVASIAFASALLSGILPARRASALDPVAVLSRE